MTTGKILSFDLYGLGRKSVDSSVLLHTLLHFASGRRDGLWQGCRDDLNC